MSNPRAVTANRVVADGEGGVQSRGSARALRDLSFASDRGEGCCDVDARIKTEVEITIACSHAHRTKALVCVGLRI